MVCEGWVCPFTNPAKISKTDVIVNRNYTEYVSFHLLFIMVNLRILRLDFIFTSSVDGINEPGRSIMSILVRR